jgi:peptide/nickel transport system ATP-binding protein
MSAPPPTTTAGEDPVLSVTDLHVGFELRQWGFLRAGTVRAVDGVDLELTRGEAVAFVGESGCGKSTLARTLLGLHRPSHGRVVFEGRSPVELDRRALKAMRGRAGYVQQDPFAALAPFMDVGRILAEPLKIHGVRARAERERRVHAALEEVRLSPAEAFTGKFPHMLSGGQQQRVVIARALALEPALLVADEPVSMLDASVRVEILELLQRIRSERHLTLAFITHDLSTVRHFADRIFVMYAGRIVEAAPTEDLLAQPQHPYTEALLTALADPDAANAARERAVPEGEAPSLLNLPSGCRFHPRCPHFMAGLCEDKDPPAFEPRPAHTSACWLQG